MAEQGKKTGKIEEEIEAGGREEEVPLEGGAGATQEVSEIDLLKKEAGENYDKLLRLAAEFENYKKRIDKECSLSIKYAEENIIKELLPSIDNLERAIEQGRDTGDVKGLLEGLDLTLHGLLGALEKFGLKPVSDVGAPFDPNYHEALALQASTEVPENRIIQEFQKGYLYKERLIRAAKVVVSKGEA